MTRYDLLSRNAYRVNADMSVAELVRVDLMSKDYNEAWIQSLIADNPQMLPVSSLLNSNAPLVCIGREVPVGEGNMRGYIDNLYVTASGQIVIVETKLFRNQESRRMVVAQIIEYAKELQKWEVEQIEAVASDYFKRKYGQAYRIIDIMAKYGYLSFSSESALSDNISRCLKDASFLLMIVGDGIKSNVYQIADFLNECSLMKFNLAMVELEIYKDQSGTIIVPNIITKTAVIERYVSSTVIQHKAFVPVARQEKRQVLSMRDFIQTFSENGGYDADTITEFIAAVSDISGVVIGIAPTELIVKVAIDGYKCTILTFCIAQESADILIVPGRIKKGLIKAGLTGSEADNYLEFFKEYVDRTRCKTEPYEYEDGFYYADVQLVVNSFDAFLNEIKDLVCSII